MWICIPCFVVNLRTFLAYLLQAKIIWWRTKNDKYEVCSHVMHIWDYKSNLCLIFNFLPLFFWLTPHPHPQFSRLIGPFQEIFFPLFFLSPLTHTPIFLLNAMQCNYNFPGCMDTGTHGQTDLLTRVSSRDAYASKKKLHIVKQL